MITIVACALLLTLLAFIVRCIAAIPLVRTLTITIDSWADSAQGADSGPIR